MRDETVPAHVPDELIREVGHIMSPRFLADPFEFYASLHDTCPPIFYDKGGVMGNLWTTISHSHAMHALRTPENFQTGTVAVFPREQDNWYNMIPQEIDGPQHRKYRNIVDPMLSPVAVQNLSKDIRTLTNNLIDAFIDKGECEFTNEFARPLPVQVFLKFMGLPLEKLETFVRWVVKVISEFGGPDTIPVMREIEAYLATVIEEKRTAPDGGAISRIVHGTIDGRPLNQREAFGFTFFLFIGGIDTVYATMNNIWLWLARNPDRRREMIANPDRIDSQLEELLRIYGVTFSGRKVMQDCELGSVQLKEGEGFFCMLPACNYDPNVFPNPREVRFERPRKPILSFTGGVHACMGAHLARLEMKIALQEWLRRIPDFSVKPGSTTVYRPSGVIGPEKVPLVW